MGQVTIVLRLTGVTETDYGNVKNQIQSAITTYNTNHTGQTLTLDTTSSQYLATG